MEDTFCYDNQLLLTSRRRRRQTRSATSIPPYAGPSARGRLRSLVARLWREQAPLPARSVECGGAAVPKRGGRR